MQGEWCGVVVKALGSIFGQGSRHLNRQLCQLLDGELAWVANIYRTSRLVLVH